MSTAEKPPLISSTEVLERMMALFAGADTVELKLVVSENEQRAAIAALGLDPLEAQIRQVFFFDTPDLQLDRQGLVVRARRVQRKGDDAVVKLRPVVPEQLPPALRRLPGFGVEVDASPDGFVCSGRLKAAVRGATVHDVVAGRTPIRKLFSKEQRRLFAEHAPEDVRLDDLTPLGPIFVLKLKFTPSDAGRAMVCELWLYPDGSRIFELSTRCAPSIAFQVAAEGRAFLARQGISTSGVQALKTRTALELFSRELTAQAAAPDA